jgi:hypothetical protein
MPVELLHGSDYDVSHIVDLYGRSSYVESSIVTLSRDTLKHVQDYRYEGTWRMVGALSIDYVRIHPPSLGQYITLGDPIAVRQNMIEFLTDRWISEPVGTRRYSQSVSKQNQCMSTELDHYREDRADCMLE